MSFFERARIALHREVIAQRYVDVVGPVMAAVLLLFAGWVSQNNDNQAVAIASTATSAVLLISAAAILREHSWGYAVKASVWLFVALWSAAAQNWFFAAFMGLCAWWSWSDYVSKASRN